MSQRSPHYPAGPMALVAIGLFVSTWASLRLWQGAEPARSATPRAESLSASAAALAPPAKRPMISLATSTTPAGAPAEAQAPAVPRAPYTPPRLVLDEFHTLPMVAEVAPPVATRSTYDPVMELEPEIHLSVEPALGDPSTSALPPLSLARATPAASLQTALNRADATPMWPTASVWTTPRVLIEQLNALAQYQETAAWSQEVLEALNCLTAAEAIAAPAATDALDRLERLSENARNVGVLCQIPEQRVLMSRVSFGLVRRLLVWREIEHLALAREYVFAAPLDEARFTQALTELERRFASVPNWQRYLFLARWKNRSELTPAEQGALARRVLLRLETTELTPQQQALLSQPFVNDFAVALRPLAAEPVDLPRLVEALETLETEHSSAASQVIADAYQRLRWSHVPAATALGQTLDTYYRNANVRVAISDTLINMLLPQEPETTLEPVRDEILGARVFGRSETSARLRVVLLPDMRRLRLGLEAIGEVDSNTTATKGPATFHSQGRAHVHARKMLSIERGGLRVWRAQAEVDSNSELTDLVTDFDSLPFVGLIARAVAKQQHDDNYHAANYEVRGKVAAKAEYRLDTEVHQRLAEAEHEFSTKLYNPLVRLHLEPTALDLRTTERQLVARYRVAGNHQVAAFTPRPMAPNDSVLNIQLHQSTLNNVLEQLKLDGRRTDLEGLYREIAGTFSQELKPQTLENLPEKVTLQFAERDAVRVHCENGRLRLAISLAELSQGRERTWNNFTVQAYYVPDYSTLDAQLVRDGVIELIGERLNFRDQIALRGIFAKVLAKDRTFNLVHEKIARDPRLQSLKIDRFVIEDGWIGLSVTGPQVDNDHIAGEHRARTR